MKNIKYLSSFLTLMFLLSSNLTFATDSDEEDGASQGKQIKKLLRQGSSEDKSGTPDCSIGITIKESINPEDIFKRDNRLETLKRLLHIPIEFKPDVYELMPSYHLQIELDIFDRMIEGLENFVSILNASTFDAKLLVCARNRFVEYAARYMLYGESTLGYWDENEEHSIFDALPIIRKLSPSLTLKKCLAAPLDRPELDHGLSIPVIPPIGFSSIYQILTAMDQFESSGYQELLAALKIPLKNLKRLRSYFDINEHLRITLPLIEDICKLEIASAETSGQSSLFSKFENLLIINEKIPYKLQNIDLSQVQQSNNILRSSNIEQHTQARKVLAHALIPWTHLRNLGLISLHSTSPSFKDVLFLPQNKTILSESLDMVVKEFKQIAPFIEQFILTEIAESLERPTTLTLTEGISFPSLVTLSKYGADTTYLHKIIKVFQHIDFTSSPSTSAILRLIEILGETSKNLSSTIKNISNVIFWDHLEKIRDSGQHGISFQKRLVRILRAEKDLIPLLLEDFNETLHFAQGEMANLPHNWEDLQNFYNTQQTSIQIRGRGVGKLVELLDPTSLTSADCNDLRSTIHSYERVEDHRPLVENILEGRESATNISPEDFLSHVDKLSALSRRAKIRLKTAYNTLKKGQLLGKSEEEHKEKVNTLKKLLENLKDLSQEELSDRINKLIEEIRKYTTFNSLQKELEKIGIADIATWKKKWEKTQRNPSNAKIKEKESDEHKIIKVIKDSLLASKEIRVHFDALNQVLGGDSQNRGPFLKDYKALLSTEHHVTMIRHYVGVIHEAHDYIKRHDIDNPIYSCLSELCWILGAKLKDICFIGNSLAHLHDVTHLNEIKVGEYGWNFMNYSNITLYMDGRSCDCINCRHLPPSPYITSVVEELEIYRDVLERILNAAIPAPEKPKGQVENVESIIVSSHQAIPTISSSSAVHLSIEEADEKKKIDSINKVLNNEKYKFHDKTFIKGIVPGDGTCFIHTLNMLFPDKGISRREFADQIESALLGNNPKVSQQEVTLELAAELYTQLYHYKMQYDQRAPLEFTGEQIDILAAGSIDFENSKATIQQIASNQGVVNEMLACFSKTNTMLSLSDPNLRSLNLEDFENLGSFGLACKLFDLNLDVYTQIDNTDLLELRDSYRFGEPYSSPKAAFFTTRGAHASPLCDAEDHEARARFVLKALEMFQEEVVYESFEESMKIQLAGRINS
ncbi:MAG: hypothetical protein K2X28_07975 [Alphaproteobacteria bacterium]|nr:hypothetical protein [Alphaproteobacteria bacterium]